MLDSEFVNEELEDRDSTLGIPHCSSSCAHPSAKEPESRKTEELKVSHLSLDRHDKDDTHQCLRELPNLSRGAEQTFYGSEDSESADLEASSSSAPERHAIHLTVRNDRSGICQGARVVYACVGYCDSSAFPSRYSVLLASNFTHNITSVSQCCTIGKAMKVKVRVECPKGHHHDDIEILTAQACRCHMCYKARY
ncbi:Glycoprotein hormone alpha-2 [Bagarius yarrelli]|uniref:Glycoprotein hormones alpha chain n=1 Tax=Bagarius yarrelli TaxID=175774 RepID=A0A556TZ11_BAGYA|nr:Glycoprotein hormone alpha-2 [Bagarius yarrelli]